MVPTEGTPVHVAPELLADAATCGASADAMLAVVCHELRQPLGAIVSAIEVQKRSLSAERRQRAAEVIEQQVCHLGHLVDELSQVSDLAVRVTLCLERVDARELLRHALDTAAPVLQRGRHIIAVASPRERLWVLADRTRLVQVFANLLQNAGTYTPEGGTIHVSLEAIDGVMHLRVRDNGIGIPSEWLDRIFGLFERGPNSQDRPGTGIGLYLVRELVHRHGGTVTASSGGDRAGSEFHVAIPCDKDQSGQVL